MQFELHVGNTFNVFSTLDDALEAYRGFLDVANEQGDWHCAVCPFVRATALRTVAFLASGPLTETVGLKLAYKACGGAVRLFIRRLNGASQ